MSVENPNFEKEIIPGFKIGGQITVKRSNGDIENDWIISDIAGSENDRRIFVQKPGPDGHRIIKGYSEKITPAEFNELLELNNVN